jgi:hypothetical protein
MNGGDQIQPLPAGTEPPVPPPPEAASAATGGANEPPRTRAHTYIGQFSTFSKPVSLKCDDGAAYVVKGPQDGRPDLSRAIIADHVIGRLGNALGAPVPVALIDVPEELRAAQAELQHMTAGIVAHGSRLLDIATDQAGVQHVGVAENRRRFALLAILYGWAHAGDHQFLYEKNPPHQVYSVDHGHFFPGGPNWTAASLEAGGAAQADALLVGAGLTTADLKEGAERLAKVDGSAIAAIVASAPVEWGLTAEERAAMLAFLTKRRDELITAYAPRTTAN